MSRASRLIGREPALAAASSVIDDARRGAGQFLMISGAAGIGKTAMLAALIGQAGPTPLVLRGFCWEGDGAPPYWPWSQVLRASGLPAAELGEAGWLLQSGPGAAESTSAAAAADAQFRLFEAVSRCLGRLAAGRPVLVILDDLHWADEPSLRLLRFLARALTARAVLLLGAYRDTEASGLLREVASQAQQLVLTGLTPDDVGALAEVLAGTSLPAQVTAGLWQRSGGNPFFVRELTRLLAAQGSWHQPAQIPASVAETLRRRLARLSTECVRLLERAAVAGRDIEVSLLVHGATPGQEPAVPALLDEARQADVITGVTPPGFTHDLYREAILAGLNSTARAAINLSAGRALQARSGPAARVAAHLLAAGLQARPDALEYSLLAAREATARLGHEDACAHYLRALDIVSAPGAASAERVEILLELAASHERTGQSDQAARRFRQAADASRAAGDPVGLARAALGIQALGHRSGAQNAGLLGLLREASRRLEAAGGPLALQSRVLAAQARTLRHGPDAVPGDEVGQAADRAVRLAAAANDASALATARLAVHDAMWVPGTAARRLPVIAGMLDAARASGDDDLVAEAHLLRAAALLELGDPEGRDALLSYITLAGNLGHARGRWAALTRQATFTQLAGRAEESARLGEQALELGLAIGEPDAVGCFCTSRSALAAFGVDGPSIEMDAADRCGRCSRSSGPGPSPPAARRPRRPRHSATSACWTSRRGRAWNRSPRRPSCSRPRARTASGDGCTNGCARTPEPTWSWVAARPTTPPSTTTSARSRPRSATPPPLRRTSGPPWPCTSGWEPPGGPACRSRPWPGSRSRRRIRRPTSCGWSKACGCSASGQAGPAHDRYRQRQLLRFPGEDQVPAAHHVQAEGNPGVRPGAGDRRRRPGLLRCLEPVGHGPASAAHRRGTGSAVQCAGPGELRAAARRGGTAASRPGGQPGRRATGPHVPGPAPFGGPAAPAGAAAAAGVLRAARRSVPDSD
jgi:AAA ATPase domain